MATLREVESFCNRLLDVGAFKDYCPNGLQVDAGKDEIQSVITGVTASQALVDAAIGAGADLLLVHHGYFWKGESPTLTGIKGRRVRALMRHGVNLMAYHLPLDAHPELGNNRRLGIRLGLEQGAPLDEGDGLLWSARLEIPESADAMGARIEAALGRRPLHLGAEGVGEIRTVGWCTGAAHGYIERAAAAGLDAFISGEVSEQTAHLARELGIHYFAAGHHATERDGVRALGECLAAEFGLRHRFVDIPNPV